MIYGCRLRLANFDIQAHPLMILAQNIGLYFIWVS